MCNHFLNSWLMTCRIWGWAVLSLSACEASAEHTVEISVPEGFQVELVAKAPLVEHPMMGCLDERGRLFLAESAGRNLDDKQLDELRPNSIRMLEDLDGDGVFDRSTVFADKLAIPNGALWYGGSLYVAEPPGIWRFTDTDDDGIADVRDHIAGNVRSNGMSSTLHGPTLHPSGRLFWCGGQMGYSLSRDGEPTGRITPGVFSLLPDGTEHENFAVGGRANPVEVAFGQSGDVFGTIAILDFADGARHDALIHWVYGGRYSDRDDLPDAIKTTGPHLPPLSHVGQVAPAGIARYASDQFGEAFTDNLFWAQFNTHTVVRTQRTPHGASYTAADQDFAVCEDVDFHPTDVIEDADGSLLIVDTGGWFRHGCPTSRIARPESLGAIYRIRREGAHAVDDPRGSQIEWAKALSQSLIQYLDDSRPAVVERSIEVLVNRKDSIQVLIDALNNSTSSKTRLNCVWALSRKRTSEALDEIITALSDSASEVRQAAANALGLARHRKAVKRLSHVVGSDRSLHVRREAALAISRIGEVKTAAPLITALDDSSDPFFQHALIDALIRVGQTEELVDALTRDSVAIRRGALLALNHLENALITRSQIAPLLTNHDAALREAAFEIAVDQDDLRTLLKEAVPELLKNKDLHSMPEQRDSLLSSLLQTVVQPAVQNAIAETYLANDLGIDSRLLILELMRRVDLKKFPEVWLPVVESTLLSDVQQLQSAALKVVSAHRIPEFDDLLLAAALNDNLQASLRIACLEVVAPGLTSVSQDLFTFALSQMNDNDDPIERAAAARAIASMKLTSSQLNSVASVLTRADALIVPSLLNAFGKEPTRSSGQLLLQAIRQRESLDAIPKDQLSGLLRRFPDEIQDQASSVLDQLGLDFEEQKQRMQQLESLTMGGDVLRGKQIFFGEKASCSACHRVKGQGALVGPNLSTIATIRSSRDLLESIVFPSASIVQDFRPLVVATSKGQVFSGLEVRRTEKELWLKQMDLKEIRIRLDDIEIIEESSTSIMPQGLEQKLTDNELRDLLAFLLDLKPSPSYFLDE